MTAGRRTERAIDAALLAVAALVLIVAGYAFVRAAFEIPFNRDAAHWLGRARMVASGRTAYVDFEAAYAPGPYYVLSLLGTEGLRSPVLIKGLLYSFHAVNAVLVYAVLRRLGNAAPMSALLAAVYLAWMAACDGFTVEVEAMQVVFALGAAWLLTRPCGARTVFVAGLLTGASLMMKQYSLLFVPPLALAAYGSAPRADDGTPPPDLRVRRWTRAAIFCSALPVAFVLFLLMTRQGPIEPLVSLTTYGGFRYPSDGGRSMIATLVAGRAARFLTVALVIAFGMLAWRRTPRAAILCLGLVLATVPLYVRGYEHYVQLAAPSAIFVVGEFARAVGERWRGRPWAAPVAVAIVLVPCIDAAARGLADAHRLMTRAPISEQVAIARTVESAVPDTRDVLMLNIEWVYALSDVEQPVPRRELRLGEPLEGLLFRRTAARCAVVGPGRVPFAEAAAWLAAGGFRQSSVLDANLPLVLFERAPK